MRRRYEYKNSEGRFTRCDKRSLIEVIRHFNGKSTKEINTLLNESVGFSEIYVGKDGAGIYFRVV